MTQDELVQRASVFATQSHSRIDQRRKYTGHPYDEHLRAVAEIVSEVTDDPGTVAAAWLHDVVEDTPATFAEIEREFGQDIMGLVMELTDVSVPSDGNRAARKELDRQHLARASARAQTIKLADLIDNARDIAKHDPGFARVYLAEMRALLDVLVRGDERLMKRARKTLEKAVRSLGITLSDPPAPPPPHRPRNKERRRAWGLFASAFAARDIAEPLRSFDAERDAEEVAGRMRSLGLKTVGVRIDGKVAGFARLESLDRGTCGKAMRSFRHGQVIEDGASLTEVVHVLTRHEEGFVQQRDTVVSMITRNDIQKPLVRMWLFGMITLVEMLVVERIHLRWPDDSWTSRVPDGRVERARELQAERQRRGQQCALLDCLQLGDKITLLISEAEELESFGFESRRAAKRVVKDFESLRNNLAHSQDIVTHDWAQIARLTARVEEIAAEARRDPS